MAQLKTHGHCQYFSYQKCPHLSDEIMGQATQYKTHKPRTYGGKLIIFKRPSDEEIDKICDTCDMFSPKKEIP
jgi:hypothetical protein